MKEEWFSPSDWVITDLMFFLSDFFSGGEIYAINEKTCNISVQFGP